MFSSISNTVKSVKTIYQDTHLLHMANQSFGSSPIGYSTKAKAYLGQDAPLRSLVQSVVGGFFGAASLYVIGISLSPVFSTEQRKSFLSPNKDTVCDAVQGNVQKIAAKALKTCDYLESLGLHDCHAPIHKQLNDIPDWVKKTGKATSSFASWASGEKYYLESNLFGYAESLECKKKEFANELGVYRRHNYIGSVIENHNQASQYLLMGCAALSLYYFGSKLYNRAIKEKEVIDELEIKYETCAKRLEEKARLAQGNTEKMKEVKEMAQGILKNQMKSIHEIADLKLPKLQKMDAKQALIAPVIKAAKEILEV
jgi:hypothetical protein